jgi:hypothetical protein
MKAHLHVPVSILAVPILLLAPLSRADLLANFLNSDEGWSVYNDAANFAWDGGVGNIPGSIHATDTGQGTYWGFQAGPEFLDDQSEYAGAEMRWQLWVSHVQATDPAIPDVMLLAPGLALVNDLGDPDPQEWFNYVVRLEPDAGWRVSTLDGPVPTEDQFEEVMGDLHIIRIRAEYSFTLDEAWLDNVIFRFLPCYPDFDDDHDLTLFDFLAFVNLFNDGKMAADCDESGTLDLFDFLCYTNAFIAGC